MQKSDYILSLTVFALITFGLIMIYSVSKYLSLQITDGSNDKYYLTNQLVSLAIGLAAWVVFQNIDYRFWQKHSGKMLIVTLVLLLAVFLFGHSTNDAQRWINIFGFRFQPAEFVKLTTIIYLSGWFAGKLEKKEDLNKSFWLFIVVVAIISFFLL